MFRQSFGLISILIVIVWQTCYSCWSGRRRKTGMKRRSPWKNKSMVIGELISYLVWVIDVIGCVTWDILELLLWSAISQLGSPIFQTVIANIHLNQLETKRTYILHPKIFEATYGHCQRPYLAGSGYSKTNTVRNFHLYCIRETRLL